MSYTPEKNKQYLKERYQEQRAMFLSHLGGVCESCGSTDDLEFDHVDPKTKSFSIAELWPIKRLPEVYEELKKCQLLCDPCHNEKSALKSSERNSGFTHATTYAWMKKKCSCEECLSHKEHWSADRNAKRRRPGGYGPRSPRLS